MARARRKLCGICSITKNGGCLRSFCRIADSRFFRGYTAGYSGMLSARLTNPVLSRHPFCCTPFYVLFFALSLAAAASILPVFVPALRISVERGIPAVEILCVHIVLRHPKRIAEALVMDDLAFSEEFEYIAHVPIVDEPEQIVVGYARFLFCCRPVNTTKRGRIRTANVSPTESRRRLSCAIQRSILPWQVLPPA